MRSAGLNSEMSENCGNLPRELAKLRNKIDAIDSQILILLRDRLREADKIGALKKKYCLKAEDLVREQYLYSRLEGLAQELDLESGFVRSLFETIISETKRRQRTV
ncbi:putative chorismate mutase protein [Tropheryma whipplei str. Twist]|uniref:Putative chorismate mutase protein n=2 Tax=Tropheryma whipplei TaxID=2039 RepID=Q83FE9_TROWT|nr:chorismate mutase [Tropheryma whipplei]AAO44890.1 putative chorismate mutase protein [Tropheryma whipplei str. Twist]CAD67461.1 putative chorismate mutase [Tropheryma whipplei TW08/27]